VLPVDEREDPAVVPEGSAVVPEVLPFVDDVEPAVGPELLP